MRGSVNRGLSFLDFIIYFVKLNLKHKYFYYHINQHTYKNLYTIILYKISHKSRIWWKNLEKALVVKLASLLFYPNFGYQRRQ